VPGKRGGLGVRPGWKLDRRAQRGPTTPARGGRLDAVRSRYVAHGVGVSPRWRVLLSAQTSRGCRRRPVSVAWWEPMSVRKTLLISFFHGVCLRSSDRCVTERNRVSNV
jgi:hypothetical protein